MGSGVDIFRSYYTSHLFSVTFPNGVNIPLKGVLWYSMCEMFIWAEQYYGVWYNNH